MLRNTVKAAPGNYHIDIAICDAGDRKYDSAVFVQLDSIAGVNCDAESCGGTDVAPERCLKRAIVYHDDYQWDSRLYQHPQHHKQWCYQLIRRCGCPCSFDHNDLRRIKDTHHKPSKNPPAASPKRLTFSMTTTSSSSSSTGGPETISNLLLQTITIDASYPFTSTETTVSNGVTKTYVIDGEYHPPQPTAAK